MGHPEINLVISLAWYYVCDYTAEKDCSFYSVGQHLLYNKIFFLIAAKENVG